MIRRSLTTGLFLRLVPVLALAAAIPWVLAYWMNQALWLALVSGALLLGLMWWVLRRALSPLNALFRALAGTVNSYRDGEYGFGVHWSGRDALGELVSAHAALGEVLREQRHRLAQRELLLDTMVQNTPVAMLVAAPGGDGEPRVVFANLAARRLLHGGRKLEGQRLALLLAAAPVELRDAVARGGDSLFAVRGDTAADEPGEARDEPGEERIYHLARRQFRLNGRRHELLLLRAMTSELRRQEVHTWKKVIRVISHELNNSLAPIASLAHSGAELTRRGQTAALGEVFSTIEERARHLEGFVRGYARFAKLPQPRLESVDWAELLARLQRQMPFALAGDVADVHSRVDAAQIEQALLNLLKNAHEASDGMTDPAGAADDRVVVRLTRLPGRLRVEVLDRGTGMNAAVLQNALVPFYSTKRHGTGLGLALAREIVEAHGGHLSLHNRDTGGLCVSVQLPR